MWIIFHLLLSGWRDVPFVVAIPVIMTEGLFLFHFIQEREKRLRNGSKLSLTVSLAEKKAHARANAY